MTEADTHYATVPESPTDRPKAGSQAAAILEVFEETGRAMSPSEVLARLRAGPRRAIWDLTPLTSVRARMTTLQKARPPRLDKTTEIITGPMGRPEHRWRLAVPPAVTQGQLF